jgi:hypothetical protein
LALPILNNVVARKFLLATQTYKSKLAPQVYIAAINPQFIAAEMMIELQPGLTFYQWMRRLF